MDVPFNLNEEAKTASSDKPTDVELTIYQVEPSYYYYAAANGFDINNGLALIKEMRLANLPGGLTKFQMKGTAQYLDSTSLHLKDLTDGTTQVLEQNYQYDLVSNQKLMENYIGKEIEVVTSDGKGGKEIVKGTLLSFSDGIVLKTATGISSLKDFEKVNYPSLPEGLITSPTVEWLLSNSKAGEHKLQASYLATGLNWHADYVAIANSDDSNLDITGWVSIKNNGGATFENAKLKLIAGDINLVRAASQPKYDERALGGANDYGATTPQFAEESLFEYHLYSLQRPATLKNNEDKQITLFDSKGTPVQKQLVYEGDGTKVKVKLLFDNSKKNNLGMPMPKGKVRVYKADSTGALQFVGEDQIDHTPEDEKVRLFLGNAFDVVAEKKQTSQKELGICASQSTYSVELRNHKKESVEVVVLQNAYGEAEITNENFKSTKESSSQFSWKIPVSASGSATLTYTLEQRYC
ncbi:MAG: DUF4139 domain-containing protein [Candidatus Micrarchaeota archaeon]